MQDIHKQLSAQCFNACWDLIDKPERTEPDVEDMRLLAYASLWHWKQREDCAPTNLSVGYWQLARVEALAGNAVLAHAFGEKSLRAARDGEAGPFYVGYAFEALARAALVDGKREVTERHLAAAREELARIVDEEEAALLRADLDQLSSLA